MARLLCIFPQTKSESFMLIKLATTYLDLYKRFCLFLFDTFVPCFTILSELRLPTRFYHDNSKLLREFTRDVLNCCFINNCLLHILPRNLFFMWMSSITLTMWYNH